MIKKLVTALALSSICAVSLLHAQSSTTAEQAQQVSQEAPPPSPERLQAAKEFLLAVDMPAVLDQSIQQIVKTQIIQNREIYMYQDILIDYYTRYMGWEAIQEEVIALYADRFTVEELKTMHEFFATPTGKKVMGSMPELLQRTTIIGSRNLQPHMEKLQEKMNERREELMLQQQTGGR